MKVLASLVGLALGQDRWTGFDYDYGFGSAERNQISQSSAGNVLIGQSAGTTLTGQGASTTPVMADGSASNTLSNLLEGIFNPYNTHTSDAAGVGQPSTTIHTHNQRNIMLGNGLMCWHCDAHSVYRCFESGQFQVCQGQDYFCFYHERRKIGHYFNRREKYIDHIDSNQNDLFLVRVGNEAWNAPDNLGDATTHFEGSKVTRSNYYESGSTFRGAMDTAGTAGKSTDNAAPLTDIHVMAGCQQPMACLRQQSMNQALNIGVSFYGPGTGSSDETEIGSIGAATNNQDFTTYFHPTSRRNVREGLCRIGKDWTYYSGKYWIYDNSDIDDNDDITHVIATTSSDTAPASQTTSGDPTTAEMGITNADDNNLWGRGIYDAHDAHGHQFWHERESWYNGMRPNGFKQHLHGGKGTESVCHFCCNPASSDGHFCNRNLLDKRDHTHAYGDGSPNARAGIIFSSAAVGDWFKVPGAASAGNHFAHSGLVRADDPNLEYRHTPLAGSYDPSSAWLSEHRFHGMFRNPETQVSQEYLPAVVSGRK